MNYISFGLGILVLLCSPLLLSGKRLSSQTSKSSSRRRNIEASIKKARSSSKKNFAKKPILPVPKESIFIKALKGIDGISKSISNTRRELKAYFSSDFEALLLKLTSPDDFKPSSDDMNRIITTIESFVRNLDTLDPSNPYRVTLHKIYCKMIEESPYTKLKALLILHSILRYTEPEDSAIFKLLIPKMSREYVKSSHNRYFDMATICSSPHSLPGRLVPPSSFNSFSTPQLEEFLQAYTSFVLKRSRAFTSQFEELQLIAPEMRTEDICAQVMQI